MSEVFDKPNRSDLGKGTVRPFERSIEYAAGKTAEIYVAQTSEEFLKEKGKLGFYYYDKERGHNVGMDNEVLVHLATFTQLYGKVFDSRGGRPQVYWSNLVQDSRAEPFTLFSGYGQGRVPIATGLYRNIAGQLPAGVHFRIVFAVYSPGMDEVFLLPFTKLIERGVVKSISESIGIRERDVRLFSLADAAIWGFRHKGYEETDAYGETFQGLGDLFFMPVFECGVIRTGHALFAECTAKKEEIANWYRATREVSVTAEVVEAPISEAGSDMPF